MLAQKTPSLGPSTISAAPTGMWSSGLKAKSKANSEDDGVVGAVSMLLMSNVSSQFSDSCSLMRPPISVPKRKPGK